LLRRYELPCTFTRFPADVVLSKSTPRLASRKKLLSVRHCLSSMIVFKTTRFCLHLRTYNFPFGLLDLQNPVHIRHTVCGLCQIIVEMEQSTSLKSRKCRQSSTRRPSPTEGHYESECRKPDPLFETSEPNFSVADKSPWQPTGSPAEFDEGELNLTHSFSLSTQLP